MWKFVHVGYVSFHVHYGYVRPLVFVRVILEKKGMLHLTRFRVRDFYIRKSFRFYRVQRVLRVNPIFQ